MIYDSWITSIENVLEEFICIHSKLEFTVLEEEEEDDDNFFYVIVVK
jgi:hypothetical protein